MEQKYGVVLVGCGYIGEQHLADIYYRENVRIVATVDVDIERAKLMARKYGAQEFSTDYCTYLGRDDVDIAIVATYVSTHLTITRDFLNAGKHVLCEKPVAANRDDGEAFFKMAKEVQKRGVYVLVGHILRYNSSYRKIREMIRSGEIGTLRLMRFVQNHHAVNWERYRRLLEDCPPVLDCGVHYLDVMQWISGQKIVQVKGGSFLLDSDAHQNNYNLVNVQLSGGSCGHYEAGWSRNLHHYSAKEFMGDKGYIKLTLQMDRISDKEEGDLIECYYSETGEHKSINVQSVYKDMNAQFQTLIQMIEGKPVADFCLEDAEEAFNAAMTAVEDGSAFEFCNSEEHLSRV